MQLRSCMHILVADLLAPKTLGTWKRRLTREEAGEEIRKMEAEEGDLPALLLSPSYRGPGVVTVEIFVLLTVTREDIYNAWLHYKWR